jgi:hypothetical protein
MRAAAVLIPLLISVQACKSIDPRQPRSAGEAQIVSLVVRSEPEGALVRVNKLEKTWTTPCDIADWSLAKGPIDVEVTLAGYETVKARPHYDGYDPVILEMRLRPVGAAARAEPAPVLPPPPPPATAKPTVEAAPLKVEPATGGTWVKATSAGAKLKIDARCVVTDPARPGELFLPNVPPEKVRIEFLDPRTDAVLHTVEFSPGTGPAPAALAPEPKAAPPIDADRVGEVKVVSNTYGVFVKLDPGLAVQPGEEILIFREGREIARTKILKVTKADAAYPDGAVQVPTGGPIQKGDEVRRTKP